jgi:hypothetical protein
VATRIEHLVIDDLDASSDGVGTYRFALEGVEYEIDLSPANLQRLRTALAAFIRAGRRLPKHKTGKPAAGTKRIGTGELRRWWAEHQQTHHLPGWRAGGPIPRTVHDAYAQAHPALAGSVPSAVTRPADTPAATGTHGAGTNPIGPSAANPLVMTQDPMGTNSTTGSTMVGRHDCQADATLVYVADYGAPGVGQAWACTACGRGWSRIGDSFYPAETGAHLLRPEDVE